MRDGTPLFFAVIGVAIGCMFGGAFGAVACGLFGLVLGCTPRNNTGPR